MASVVNARVFILLVAFVCIAVSPALVAASDPDPLQDFCVADLMNVVTLNGLTCKPAANVVAADFASQLLRKPGQLVKGLGLQINLAFANTFPALNTQGLSIARIDFQPLGLNPPHVHPRATEVVFLVSGTLTVGFVTSDGNNTLFQQTLQAGDLFVFPRGLVHFQFNPDKKQSALAISGLNSQNPGASQVAAALFASNPPLPDQVLEIALGIGKNEVLKLEDSVRATLAVDP